MRLASSRQKPSGSLSERAYISSYCALVTCARAFHSSGTGKISWDIALLLRNCSHAHSIPSPPSRGRGQGEGAAVRNHVPDCALKRPLSLALFPTAWGRGKKLIRVGAGQRWVGAEAGGRL